METGDTLAYIGVLGYEHFLEHIPGWIGTGVIRRIRKDLINSFLVAKSKFALLLRDCCF